MTREEKLRRWEEIGRLAQQAMRKEASEATKAAIRKAKTPARCPLCPDCQQNCGCQHDPVRTLDPERP